MIFSRRSLVAMIALMATPMSALAQTPLIAGLFGSRSHFTEVAGEDIYRGICAGCHMPDGNGAEGAGRYPSVANDPSLASSDYAVGIVLRGGRGMPPFAATLSNEQIAAVVNFLRANFGNALAPDATAEAVKAAR